MNVSLSIMVDIERQVEAAYRDLNTRLEAILAKPGDQVTREENAIACAIDHAVTNLHNLRVLIAEAYEAEGLTPNIKLV